MCQTQNNIMSSPLLLFPFSFSAFHVIYDKNGGASEFRMAKELGSAIVNI